MPSNRSRCKNSFQNFALWIVQLWIICGSIRATRYYGGMVEIVEQLDLTMNGGRWSTFAVVLWYHSSFKYNSTKDLFRNCLRNFSRSSFKHSSRDSFEHFFGIPPRFLPRYSSKNTRDFFRDSYKDLYQDISQHYWKAWISRPVVPGASVILTKIAPGTSPRISYDILLGLFSEYLPEFLQRFLQRFLLGLLRKFLQRCL